MADLPLQLSSGLADRYRLERELGRGGMATVYWPRISGTNGRSPSRCCTPNWPDAGPERFQREIETAARLQHPHIVTVYDSGEAAGQLWFTMPYVEGESLRDRLRRERQLSVDDALRIAREVAQALEYAHGTASSTATSSRRTSSPATAIRWWPTSASPARSAAATSASLRPGSSSVRPRT